MDNLERSRREISVRKWRKNMGGIWQPGVNIVSGTPKGQQHSEKQLLRICTYTGSASDSGFVRLDPPNPTIRPFVFNLV